MKIDKFTVKAQEAISEGQSLARRANNPSYEPEHLARALLTQENGVFGAILKKIGADPSLVGARIEETLARLPRLQGSEGGATLGQRLLRVFDTAEDEAKKLKDEYVSSEHLVIALAQDKGAVGEALKASGVTRD